MVEFALVLPILLLLVLGVMQFSIVLHDYLAITDAARVGAREAAVSRGQASAVADVKAKVVGAAGDLSKLTTDDVTVSPDPSGAAPGSDVTVTVTYPYDIDLLGFVVASGELTSKATERVE
jgi:Flp pilus assembly protein TadG